MGFDRELSVAVDAARRAGAEIRALFNTGLAVEKKGDDSPVTEADRRANEIIVAALGAAFPDDAILSEELPDDGRRAHTARVWMVDPLDGTKDFIRGREGFSVMIGLCTERPLLGVVYQPLADKLYAAAPGLGATVQQASQPPTALRVSGRAALADVRLVASRSHRTPTVERVRTELGVREELNIGSVGIKLGLIAEGDRDLYVNPGRHSKRWDTCGPEAILVAAGGRLTDLHGELLDYHTEELSNLFGLIASNGHLHDDAVARLAPLFPKSARLE